MKIEVGDHIEITVVSKIAGYFCSLKDDVITISTCDDLEENHRIGINKERVASIGMLGVATPSGPEDKPEEEKGKLLPFKPRDPRIS